MASGKIVIYVSLSITVVLLLLALFGVMSGGNPSSPTSPVGISKIGVKGLGQNNNRVFVKTDQQPPPLSRNRWTTPPVSERGQRQRQKVGGGDSAPPTIEKEGRANVETPQPLAATGGDDRGLVTPAWIRPSNPEGEAQQRDGIQLVPHCTYHEEPMVPGVELDDALSFKEWNHYVSNHSECLFKRDLQCTLPDKLDGSAYSGRKTSDLEDDDDTILHPETKTRVKTNVVRHLANPIKRNGTASKGRALVLMMIGGFDPEDSSSQWGNIEYFLRKGYMLPEVETKLFDAVDYVVYRSHPDVQQVTPCAQHGNLLMVWVQPSRCDLCAHAKLLQWLGYKSRFSKVVPDEKFIVESWPYKSIIFLNSGIRGPIQHEKSGSWVDSVSMAGEAVRPLHMKDDWMFTTVAASRFNKERGYKNILYQLHLQSYFLVVPLSALAYYFNLFLKMGCEGPIDFPELPGKWACILRAELMTLLPYTNPATNGLEMIDRSKRRDKFYRAWDAYAFGTKTKYDPSVPIDEFWETDSQRRSKLWVDYNDPCQAIFVKFGGEVYLYQGPYVHHAINSLTRYKMLKHSKPLESGIANLLFGTVEAEVDNTTKMWWNKVRVSQGDEELVPLKKCEMLNEIAMGLGKKWERPG